MLLKLTLFWIYLALGFPYSIGRKAGISNYVSFSRTLSYIILPFLQQSDSDNEDQEEEVYDHEEEEHRHNYAENPSGLTRNSLIGKQLFRIYEKDPRPSVERKKELAKKLKIPYQKLTKWFETRRQQDIKGLYLLINIKYKV